MKQKPENWKDLDYDRQAKHLLGECILPCHCNHKFGERCKMCDALPDVEEKDRDYYSELLIILRYMAKNSYNSNDYHTYRSFVEIDDPEEFNDLIRQYFITEEGKFPVEFDIAFGLYHKSIRQADYYTHLTIRRDKFVGEDEDYVSTGILDSMLHTFLNTSDVPYNAIKLLISL